MMRRHTNVVKFNLRNFNQDAQGSGAPSSVAVNVPEDKFGPPKKLQTNQETSLKMIIKNPKIARDLEHILQQQDSDESMLKRFKHGKKQPNSLLRQKVSYVQDSVKPDKHKLLPMMRMKIQTGQDDDRS